MPQQAKRVTEIRHAACDHTWPSCTIPTSEHRGPRRRHRLSTSGSAHLRRCAAPRIRFAATTSAGSLGRRRRHHRQRRRVLGARQDLGRSPPSSNAMGAWISRTIALGRPASLVAARRIVTGLWPGFPSDIVSLVTVLAAPSTTPCSLAGCKVAPSHSSSWRDAGVCSYDHRIIITGPTKLRGRTSTAATSAPEWRSSPPPSRADGESTVLEIETVERAATRRWSDIWRLGGCGAARS